jgi:hypothetical protein
VHDAAAVHVDQSPEGLGEDGHDVVPGGGPLPAVEMQRAALDELGDDIGIPDAVQLHGPDVGELGDVLVPQIGERGRLLVEAGREERVRRVRSSGPRAES